MNAVAEASSLDVTGFGAGAPRGRPEGHGVPDASSRICDDRQDRRRVQAYPNTGSTRWVGWRATTPRNTRRMNLCRARIVVACLVRSRGMSSIGRRRCPQVMDFGSWVRRPHPWRAMIRGVSACSGARSSRASDRGAWRRGSSGAPLARDLCGRSIHLRGASDDGGRVPRRAKTTRRGGDRGGPRWEERVREPRIETLVGREHRHVSLIPGRREAGKFGSTFHPATMSPRARRPFVGVWSETRVYSPPASNMVQASHPRSQPIRDVPEAHWSPADDRPRSFVATGAETRSTQADVSP